MALPTAEEFTNHAVHTIQVMKAWAKEEFHLDHMPIKAKFPTRQLSYYGQAGILRNKSGRFTQFELKLVMHDFTHYPHFAVSEYKSFNKSKTIGGFETDDWQLGLDTLIAHEMSHLVQFALKMSAFDHLARAEAHPLVSDWQGDLPVFGRMGVFEANHGSFFQHIYKRFRERWINHRVAGEAYTTPTHCFIVPDDFEERLAKMPRSGLEGIRFMSNGRMLEVVGRNPNTRKRLFNYQVREVHSGKYLAIKMALIAAKSPEAKILIQHDPVLFGEYQAHCRAIQTKLAANLKSSQTKRRRG